MPDAIHVLLLATHAATLAGCVLYANRARRYSQHAKANRDSARNAADRAAVASGAAVISADRAATQAERATHAAGRAHLAASRASHAASQTPAEPDAADVIPFRRPSAKPIGPRLADLDSPA